MQNPILYIDGERLFSRWKEIDKATQSELLEAWGKQCAQEGLMIGSIQLGQCIGYRVRGGRVGLVIEWHEDIEVAVLQGGSL